jgi:hypothetical protein
MSGIIGLSPDPTAGHADRGGKAMASALATIATAPGGAPHSRALDTQVSGFALSSAVDGIRQATTSRHHHKHQELNNGVPLHQHR